MTKWTNDKYILDEYHQVKPADDFLKWAEWFENRENRIVRQDEENGVRVSTVFLGIDHNWSGEGPPVLFETMVFGGPTNEDTYRCCTWDQAIEQHRKVALSVGIFTDPPARHLTVEEIQKLARDT